MVDGQTGALVVVQYHVVEGLKRNLEFVTIPHHFAKERSVMVQIQKQRNAMNSHAIKVSTEVGQLNTQLILLTSCKCEVLIINELCRYHIASFVNFFEVKPLATYILDNQLVAMLFTDKYCRLTWANSVSMHVVITCFLDGCDAFGHIHMYQG